MKITGAAAAIITPFLDEKVNEVDYKIDWDGLKKNVKFQNKYADFIVVNGTTGESATLSPNEHHKVSEFVLENTKIPVVAGTGSNSTREALEHTRHAKDIGADACLVVHPYYNRPPHDKVKKNYFSVLAEKVDIPQIVYIVPSRTGKGTELPPEDIADLANEHSNIVGVKEATGKPERAKEILSKVNRKDFVVYSGDDPITQEICENGGKGAISVHANIMPDVISKQVNSILKGNAKDVKKIDSMIKNLCKATFQETNPIGIKEIMNIVGAPSGNLRPPMGRMTKKHAQKLKKELEKVKENGLLDKAKEFYG